MKNISISDPYPHMFCVIWHSYLQILQHNILSFGELVDLGVGALAPRSPPRPCVVKAQRSDSIPDGISSSSGIDHVIIATFLVCLHPVVSHAEERFDFTGNQTAIEYC